MSKYVRDTAAANAIKAILILKGTREVATVLAHYAKSGGVRVNVFQHGEAVRRCAKAAKIDENKASDKFGFQHAHAGGYGYDKFTAAISGLMIDGHIINNHCGARQPLPKGCKVFPKDFKPRKGFRLANYIYTPERAESLGLPKGAEGWADCYRESGLDYLKAIGYNVVTVL